MSVLFFDCTHGVRKDTFASSLIALLLDPQSFLATLNDLNFPGLDFELFLARDQRNIGVFLSVKDEEAEGEGPASEHSHHSLAEVHGIIEAAGLSEDAMDAVKGIYGILAAAEAKAHGVGVSEARFHEVGCLVDIAYLSAACMAMLELAPEACFASEVCTGSGFVDCAHGRLSIPAPATANVLEGVPTFTGSEEGEMTTPTGAALVRYFAKGFGEMPPMDVEAFGFGVGREGLSSKSTFRAVLGELR